jgi:glutamate-ammonia-ligase adenylyltransferase
LSDLATVLIQAAYEIVEADLRRHYGKPMHQDRNGRWMKTGFAVIAMGKLGGGELNFSSDIDVIYVYGSDDGHPRSEGRNVAVKSVSNEEYFEYLARALTRALAEPTQEGLIFRVDLRLRAEGSIGRLARSLAGYEQYYQTRGQAWERQALLKAWPVAGDVAVGRAFLRRARRFIFGGRLISDRPQAEIIEEIKAVKALIDGKMEVRGHTHRNVKLGTGGIREIEFLVQAVQILCGKHRPGILDRNTLRALARLGEEGFLSPAEQRTLVQAYLFLRDVEHKLQMVHDLQTHALPDSRDELIRCAVRLGYSGGGERALSRFMADHRRHTAQVNRLFRTLEASGRSRIWKAVERVMSEAG